MHVGDLVLADPWLEDIGGCVGIITTLQDVEHCASAWVLFASGISHIRLDNLSLAS